MAMSKTGLRDRIIAQLAAQGIVTTGNGLCRDTTDYMLLWATAIANAVIDEIQANAKAVGTDTGTYGGDSHNLSIQ